jgi:hypothetical protein
MDRALHKLYSGRKELRKAEPAFLRGVEQAKVPALALHELSKGSADSLRSPRADTCRLPKIARQSTNRGSQTFRSLCLFLPSLLPSMSLNWLPAPPSARVWVGRAGATYLRSAYRLNSTVVHQRSMSSIRTGESVGNASSMALGVSRN